MVDDVLEEGKDMVYVSIEKLRMYLSRNPCEECGIITYDLAVKDTGNGICFSHLVTKNTISQEFLRVGCAVDTMENARENALLLIHMVYDSIGNFPCGHGGNCSPVRHNLWSPG